MTQIPSTATTTRPPLRRLKSDRVLGGVCGGVARSLGLDPVLVRVIVVILALFAGGGVLVYLAAWLLIPEEDQQESTAQRWVGGKSSHQTTLIIVISVVIALSIAIPSGHLLGMGPHLGPPGFVLLLAAIAFVVWLMRRDETPPPTQPASEETAMTTAVLPNPAEATPGAPGDLPVSPPPAVVVPQTPRERSVLGLLTVSATALVAGVLVMVNLATASPDFDATTVFGAMLGTVAVGLLVGTAYGRSRGLIFLGVILALFTAVSSALPDVNLSGGVGDRTWRPVTSSDLSDPFELGIGEATLDLRNLVVPTTVVASPISATVGLGELMVLIPPDVDVQVSADVGAGEINVLGTQINGTDRHLSTLIDVPNETGVMSLDLEAGVGQIAVKRSLGVPPLPSITQGAKS